MKLNNQFFEDIFNKIESPDFKEAYWEELEKRLDKEKKRKKVIVLFIFMLTILVSLGVQFLQQVEKQRESHAFSKVERINNKTLGKSLIHARQYEIKTVSPKWELVKTEMQAGGIKPLLFLRKPHLTMSAFIHNEVKVENRLKDVLTRLPLIEQTFSTDLHEAIGLLYFNRSPQLHRKVKIREHGYWSLDAGAIVNHVGKTMQFALSGVNLDYMQKRKREEHAMLFVAPKVSLMYNSNRGLVASIGFEYAQYGERVSYTPYSLQQDIVKHLDYHYDSIAIFNFSRMTSSWRRDTNLYINYDTVMREKYNSKIQAHNGTRAFRYFEVPVMMGYRVDKGRYAISLQSGLTFGLLYSQSVKGYYLNPEGQDTRALKQERGSVSKCILSYTLQFRISRSITENISVFAAPALKLNMRPLYSNDLVKQRYNALGCFMGVSFKVN